jgi:ubiquinone/menaquinone biosynthesis C-methylase UbiE
MKRVVLVPQGTSKNKARSKGRGLSGGLLRQIFRSDGQTNSISNSIKVWAPRDLRLQQTLFHANVPTFILSNDQRFLDWNTAFDMIFAGDDSLAQVRRGGHVQEWYAKLDNYRRVPKRTEQLYGEAILPITDRERVTFLSAKYGRIVFSRIMSPVVDRATGRIMGWTVVLNINSVNRRQEFFADLYAVIAKETQMIRHAAGIDGVLGRFPGRQHLLQSVCEIFPANSRILEFSCGTGALTAMLAFEGFKVTAVDNDIHQLRVARERCRHFSNIRFVRISDAQAGKLPSSKFDGVVFNATLTDTHNLLAAIPELYRAIKSVGTLVLIMRADHGTIESLFDTVKGSLESQGRYENLKHQFSQVAKFQSAIGAAHKIGEDPREALVLEMLSDIGFAVDGVDRDADDGQTIVIKARK